MGDAGRIITACEEMGAQLVAVLTTHYHADHSGGNEELRQRFPDLHVLVGAGDHPRTPGVTGSVSNCEVVQFAGLQFQCMDTPCHTRGHVAFFLTRETARARRSSRVMLFSLLVVAVFWKALRWKCEILLPRSHRFHELHGFSAATSTQ